jgi:hypothetical protein
VIEWPLIVSPNCVLALVIPVIISSFEEIQGIEPAILSASQRKFNVTCGLKRKFEDEYVCIGFSEFN